MANGVRSGDGEVYLGIARKPRCGQGLYIQRSAGGNHSPVVAHRARRGDEDQRIMVVSEASADGLHDRIF